MKSHHYLGLLLLLSSASANAAVMNYVVTGYATGSGVFGGPVTDVAGGVDTQTTTATAGVTFVDFRIGNADAIVGDKFLAANINALPTVATLRVTVGAISGGSTELMIARTSDSQGLTDIGTMSVLLVGTGTNSATFDFQWRNAANTAILTGSDQMVFTSYDIDFTQRNRVAVADYSLIGTAPGTNLNVSTASGTTSVRDPRTSSGSSVTSDPLNAYAFLTVAGDYEQSVSVDKAGGGNAGSGYGTVGNQLYMFSFRSPSPLINTIPEPSAALLGGLGLLALLRRRR